MRYYPRGILSPLRLPIPPQARASDTQFTRILVGCFYLKIPIDDWGGEFDSGVDALD